MGSRRTGGGARHLLFKKLPLEKGKKLHKYEVINEQFGDLIGHIRWRGGWRQYVFRAIPDVDMSRSCHKEIDIFIDSLMEEWRKGKKK